MPVRENAQCVEKTLFFNTEDLNDEHTYIPLGSCIYKEHKVVISIHTMETAVDGETS